jgi:hypothetical protein
MVYFENAFYWYFFHQNGLRMFTNRVLIRILETKREVVPGGWRKMQNEVLLDMYCYL